MEVSEVCVICNQLIDGTSPTATLGEKGSLSTNKASQSRGDSIHSKSGQKVHQDCRRKYCNPQQVAKQLGHNIQKSGLRSSEGQFTWSTDCFFCGQPANLGRKRKSSGNDVFQVKTIEMKDKILAICRDRGDAWEDTVQSRLLHVHDLHAADAVYHKVCHGNFRTRKQVPAVHDISSKRQKSGRPQDEERMGAFLEVASFLAENDDEQITIQDQPINESLIQ